MYLIILYYKLECFYVCLLWVYLGRENPTELATIGTSSFS